MRLDQALVQQRLCESRQEAQELIAKGLVLVNGTIVTKQIKQVTSEHITVTGGRKYVSRGGEKLEGILLDVFKNEEAVREALHEKTALDIGSSTGGFTDCLLQFGIQHVTAVDVGSSQLHKKLRDKSSVSLHENTDIRSYPHEIKFDVIVADVSFISLDKILETILSFGKNDSYYFLLIKPQFEVGKGNTKKGIVKDTSLVSEIINKYKVLLEEKGLTNILINTCHLEGGDGNQEYFVYGKQK